MSEELDGEGLGGKFWHPGFWRGLSFSLQYLSPTDLAYPYAHNENSSAAVNQDEPHGHHQDFLPPAA